MDTPLQKTLNPRIQRQNQTEDLLRVLKQLRELMHKFIYEEKDKPETIIIDARTPQEHFHARIPGSILHNYDEGIGDMVKMIKDVEMLKKDFEKIGITQDKQIICYCHSGIRAAHTYLQLKQAGFANVRLYRWVYHRLGQA